MTNEWNYGVFAQMISSEARWADIPSDANQYICC